jgi:riboflavin kinase/FMN adenylyltransferase
MGMLNIGHRPTVNNGEERSIEVHILDFDGDLYGMTLQIEFLDRLREERHFESIDELIAQLEMDKLRVRELAIDNSQLTIHN